ncbi:P-loop containing nucleoside triphosphate hydrolase protein [Phlebopus sp. FC_14]|nr:P-loop containing nucleoside triphosphate hydrolase protein [Phlebopus sp. FC_14]
MASSLKVTRTTCRTPLVSNPAPSMLSSSVFALRTLRCLTRPSRRCQATTSAVQSVSARGINTKQSVELEPIVKQHENPSQPKTWRSLRGRISRDTIKALTEGPLKLTVMTPVQSRVISLLPDLVQPWDPKGFVPPVIYEPHPSGSTSPAEHSQSPRDLLVRARTGTGKCFTFLITAIESRLKYIEHHTKLAITKTGLASSPDLEERVRTAYRRLCAGSLIICPTRELAIQIANEALKLTAHQPDFEVRLFVGGAQKGTQLREWMQHKRDLVVATPGRLRDLLENEPEIRKGFKDCPMLILDEADTLLDMGFRDDIDAICSFLPKPPARQTLLFSATMPRAVRQIATSILSRQHAFIDTSPPLPLSSLPSLKVPRADCSAITTNGVKGLRLPLDDELSTHAHVPQFHTLLPHAKAYFPTLLKLIAHDQLVHGKQSKVIVFFPTTHTTALAATLLRCLIRKHVDISPRAGLLKGKRNNSPVIDLGQQSFLVPFAKTHIFEMHSKLSSGERSITSNNFREASLEVDEEKKLPSVLVTSDVSARGVDYPDVTRVIQVGIPNSERTYVHRVGRTARGTNAMTSTNPDSASSKSNSDPQGKKDAGQLEGIGPARADMVLLPFEAGYITWQLMNIPIKAFPLETLDSQIKALIEGIRDASLGGHSLKVPHHHVGANLDLSEAAFQGAFSALLPWLDSDAIQQAAASLMGYYLPMITSLRSQPGIVLEGVLSWASALGADIPLTTTDPKRLLAYLGVSLPGVKNLHMDGQRIAGGGPKKAYGKGGKIKRPHKWMGRGKVKKAGKKSKQGA